MQVINALSLSPVVKDWLSNSPQPRILYVFESVCNLINERREILSIVGPEIGNGPFNLMIENKIPFSNLLDISSPISICTDQLNMGDLIIETAGAKVWNSQPDWQILHANRDTIFNQLTKLRITTDRATSLPDEFCTSLVASLSHANISSSMIAAKQLAGLGIGLTPSGDDFIMGALYAAWIIHPIEVSKILAEEIADAAAPLTTSLSGAWLRAAGKGQAGILWHYLFEALVSHGHNRIEEAINNILEVGETSGADALAGFIGTFVSWKERIGTQHE